ncbi:helicase HerA-like domain-containing protein [Nocardia takedensis]|uniref:helicase HerA-like domain-containing protein n=1 Tax=Nocardia takedensis TaxID=259390 RepID=UPI0002EFE45A|nr:helicase HerA-like domain-containing protein [Nocardia takedensis]
MSEDSAADRQETGASSAREKAQAARAAALEAARKAAEAQAAAEAAERDLLAQEAAVATGVDGIGAVRAAEQAERASEDAGAADERRSAAEADLAAADATLAREIADGYAVTGAALELGTVVVDGRVDPSARVRIPLATLNRHGLVAGATGTGKTKTLQGIAEQLSAAGVPVVLADVKGDLAGLSRPGVADDRITARAAETGASDWTPTAFPTEFVSLGADGVGVPIRATVTSFGPVLMSKVLGLNETQESTLGLIFHWADSQGLALLDLKDLRAVITHLTSPEGKQDLKGIGGVSAATAGVILRALVNLEAEGGQTFFGEPELDPADLVRLSGERGVITLFELGAQAARPVMFSTFLMWVLADLFQTLPEVGDIDRPKLVFLFDEAHLLFSDASKAFLDQVEQTVKLIRSKGVGVLFCTQLPTDIPNPVLSQLGARIQHALRAFTPDDQKALSKTVRTYPKTSIYDLEQALTSLGTGEAIVTVLSEHGAPTPVAWTRIAPPRSLMEAIGADAIRSAALTSALAAKYRHSIDRESAYEILSRKIEAAAEPAAQAPPVPGRPTAEEDSAAERIMRNPAVKSFLRSAASAAGREISRSLFGTRKRR